MSKSTQELEQGTKTPREVAQAIFDDLAKGDLSTIDRYVDELAVDDFVAIGQYHGREAIRGFFQELFTAFPVFRIEVERIVADDRTAVVQWEASGEFTGGPFIGIEPTGRHADVRGVDVMEIEGGRVRHNTIYYDGNTFARQIGMLPREGSIADKAVLTGFNTVTKLRAKIRERRSG